MRKLIMFAFMSLISALSMAQVTVSGKVSDSESGEILIGANVVIAGTSYGAATDDKGTFRFNNVDPGSYVVIVSYLGYNQFKKEISVGSADVNLNFKLKSSEIQLRDVLVEANRAKERETPIAFSELKAEEISANLASRDIPLLLNTTPGVYATQVGGGYGDARINIRGFNQRNFAVMINGVPVNDMENGWVYWSNWAGLGDVTSSIQVQRGLGATPYSVSSIGGLMNVQTIATKRNLGGKVAYETGSDGLQKVTASFSTGTMSNGFAVSGLLAKTVADGYADRTWADQYSYFFTAGTQFGDHTIDLTAVGAPQEHGQRRVMQRATTWEKYGKKYNPSWGNYKGEPLDELVNFYHKPQFNINHNWQINSNLLLSNVAYLSIGKGGGTGRLGSVGYKTTSDGLIDWAHADSVNNNTHAVTNTYKANPDKNTIIGLRSSNNDHFWYGVLSTVKYTLDDQITITGGLDGRNYEGEHSRTITDLVGGSQFIESANKNVDPATKYYKDDIVNYHDIGYVQVGGLFGQVEYKDALYTAFANLSFNVSRYKRKDYFLVRDASKKVSDFASPAAYYSYLSGLDPVESDWESLPGYTFKTGLNFNIDEANNVFANVGYFSKAPAYQNAYDFNTNRTYEGLTNEKVYAGEMGYGFRGFDMALNVNAYYTVWQDKAIVNSVFISGLNDRVAYYVPGLDARHMGVEFEGRYIVTPQLELNTMFSLSENIWTNNVENVQVRPESRPDTVIRTINIFADGAYVGDSPMTTAAISATYKLDLEEFGSFKINPVYKFFGRLYAEYNPDARTTKAANEFQPFRMPDYKIVDLHFTYNYEINEMGFKGITAGFHIFNVLDEEYLSDAADGATHTFTDATFFYGQERNFNFGVSIDF